MKKLLSLSLWVVLLACNTQKQAVETPTVSQTVEKVKKPKNIVFLIGDGMGLAQVTLGMLANNDQTALEKFPVIGLHKSRSADKLITDSAAGATAFACGQRTYNGAIGVDVDTMPIKTILEMAEGQGLATGLVATSTITHATPASFIAHNKTRKDEEGIAADFLNTDIDVFIGGGKKFFERRKDDRNLLTELKSKGYEVYDFNTPMTDLDASTTHNVAYFTADSKPLPVAQGRDYLLDASKYTLDLLKARSADNGFFAMIEGSQIDWGGHANDDQYVITEFLDYNNVIDYVYEWAKQDGETLVVVTADHETGGLAIQPESKPDSLVTSFTSGYHTGVMIPVYAFGPGAEDFAGIYKNIAIFDKMVEALDLK